jgi:hypothetical protein
VIAAIRKGTAAANGEVPRGVLKVGKKKKKKNGVDGVNVIKGKRRKVKSTKSTGSSSVGPPTKSMSRGSDPKRLIPAKKATLLQPACGDLVSCSPTLFDGNQPGSYSDDHPERCFGIVI